MTKRTLGILALLGATFLWGIGPVITKVGLEQVPPFSLAFLRTVLSLVIILPFVLLTDKHKVKRQDLFKLILVGFFGSGLNAIFFMSGISKTSASSSSAIFATVPLVNAIAASLILQEKPTLIRILGVTLGFVGSLIIALGPVILGKNSINGDVWGNFLIVGSVFSWVAYIIGSKQLLKKYPPMTLMVFSFLMGTIILLPLSFLELLKNPHWYLQISWPAFSSIFYGGIISGVVALLLFQWGMQYTSAFEAGIVAYLNPVVTDIFAIPVLGEKLSPIFLAGTALIFGGVFLASSYEVIKRRKTE